MPDVRAFPAVPLVGQRLLVLGWTLIVNVECKCDRPKVLQLVVKQQEVGLNADMAICPSCGQAMHIAQFVMNAQGQLEFKIALGAMGPATAGVVS